MKIIVEIKENRVIVPKMVDSIHGGTMDNAMDNRMTVKEVAATLGVTEQAVYNWARRGRYLTWGKSSNGRLFALKDEVRKFAEGYLGRRTRKVASS